MVYTSSKYHCTYQASNSASLFVFCADNEKSSKLFEIQDTKKNHRKVRISHQGYFAKYPFDGFLNEQSQSVVEEDTCQERRKFFGTPSYNWKPFVLKVRKKTSLPLHRINKMRDLNEHRMAAIKPVVLVKDAIGKLEFQITSQDNSGESWKRKLQHFWRFSVLQTFACTPAGCNQSDRYFPRKSLF